MTPASAAHHDQARTWRLNLFDLREFGHVRVHRSYDLLAVIARDDLPTTQDRRNHLDGKLLGRVARDRCDFDLRRKQAVQVDTKQGPAVS